MSCTNDWAVLCICCCCTCLCISLSNKESLYYCIINIIQVLADAILSCLCTVSDVVTVHHGFCAPQLCSFCCFMIHSSARYAAQHMCASRQASNRPATVLAPSHVTAYHGSPCLPSMFLAQHYKSSSAAWYKTWLLIKSTLKGAVFSVFFLRKAVDLNHKAVHCSLWRHSRGVQQQLLLQPVSGRQQHDKHCCKQAWAHLPNCAHSAAGRSVKLDNCLLLQLCLR